MGGKVFFSFSTATNEIARVAYKENMQTLGCCELCRLVRDKIIISSPSRPNPQAACRIMIRAVLSHLLCIALGTGHSQPSRAAGTGWEQAVLAPLPLGRHILSDPQLIPLLAYSHLSCFIHSGSTSLPPCHNEERLRLSVTDGMVNGSWVLIYGYREVSLEESSPAQLLQQF